MGTAPVPAPIVGSIAAGLNLGLSFALIPRYDSVGAAIANATAQFVSAIPAIIYVHRRSRQRRLDALVDRQGRLSSIAGGLAAWAFVSRRRGRWRGSSSASWSARRCSSLSPGCSASSRPTTRSGSTAHVGAPGRHRRQGGALLRRHAFEGAVTAFPVVAPAPRRARPAWRRAVVLRDRRRLPGGRRHRRGDRVRSRPDAAAARGDRLRRRLDRRPRGCVAALPSTDHAHPQGERRRGVGQERGRTRRDAATSS